MEFCQSLILNDNILNLLDYHKKPIYIYEWFKFLYKIFDGAQKNDIKHNQKIICDQIVNTMIAGNYIGPSSMDLMGNVMTKFMTFNEDTFLLLEVLNKCNDILKSNHDNTQMDLKSKHSIKLLANQHKQINAKLSAMYVLSYIYKDLGKITGRSYEETIENLMKLSKTINTLNLNTLNDISQKDGEIDNKLGLYQKEEIKYTILFTIRQIFIGVGKQIQPQIAKDIYKKILKQNYLLDYKFNGLSYFVNGAVKVNSSQCILAMSKHYSYIFMADYENLLAICVKSLEFSDYLSRRTLASLISHVIFHVVYPDKKLLEEQLGVKWKLVNVEEGLSILGKILQTKLNASTNFHQTGISNLFKANQGATLHSTKCVVAGLAYAYVSTIHSMLEQRGNWLENNLKCVLDHLINNFIMGNGWWDKVEETYLLHFTSTIAGLIIGCFLNENLSENENLLCAKTLLTIINKYSSLLHTNKGGKKNVMESIRGTLLFTTLLRQLTALMQRMGSLFKGILGEYPIKAQPWIWLLNHPDTYVQNHAVAFLRGLCQLFPHLLASYVPYLWTVVIRDHVPRDHVPSMSTNQQVPSRAGNIVALGCLYSLYSSISCITPSINCTPDTIFYKLVLPILQQQGPPHLLGEGDSDVLAGNAQVQSITAAWFALNCLLLSESWWVISVLDKLKVLWKKYLYSALKDFKLDGGENRAISFHINLEHVSGCLTSVGTFINKQPQLEFQDFINSLIKYLYTSLTFISNSASVIRDMPPVVKRSMCMAKMKLFSLLRMLPPRTFEDHYNLLLRELVVEITQSPDSMLKSCQYQPSLASQNYINLWDHEPSAIFTYSNQDATCIPVASVTYELITGHLGCNIDTLETLLNIYPTKTNDSAFESLVHPNLQISAHHTYCELVDLPALSASSNEENLKLTPSPYARLLNEAVLLFGHIFPFIATKHKLQILSHLNDTVNKVTQLLGPGPTSNSALDSCLTITNILQINISAALLSALKNQEKHKMKLSEVFQASGDVPIKANSKHDLDIRICLQDFTLNTFSNPDPMLRYMGTHLLGRLAQVEKDGKLCQELFKNCVEKLKTITDVNTRASYSLALGLLYKYDGNAFDGVTNFKNAINILVTLSQDKVSVDIQEWSTAGLHLVVENSPRHAKEFAESLMSNFVNRLLQLPQVQFDVKLTIAKCISALITSLGLETQENSQQMSTIRSLLFTAISILQLNHLPHIQTEAVSCLQQLHLFIPQHINLPETIQFLINRGCLFGNHYPLRRCSISFMKQLIQKDPQTIADIVKDSMAKVSTLAFLNLNSDAKQPSVYPLSYLLFHTLNQDGAWETNKLIKYTILNLLSSTGAFYLATYLKLFAKILAHKISRDTESTQIIPEAGLASYSEDMEDNVSRTQKLDSNPSKSSNFFNTTLCQIDGSSGLKESFDWFVKVFVAECVSTLIQQLTAQKNEPNQCHFNLKAARDFLKTTENDNFLVLHLAELVRLSFICITSEYDPLKTAGLQILFDIILAFKDSPDPDYLGHYLLEQYQAQVGACLRPVFSPEDSTVSGRDSRTLAKACQVCSYWVSCGIECDTSDIKKIQQLLLSSLSKLNPSQSQSPHDALGSFSLVEKLAVLQAWAEIYSVERKKESEKQGKPYDPTMEYDPKLLGLYWTMALKDYAALSLPNDLQNLGSTHTGNFYTHKNFDSILPLYKEAWPSYAQALAYYVVEDLEGLSEIPHSKEFPIDSIYLILGVTLEALCVSCCDLPLAQLKTCLSIVSILTSSKLIINYIFLHNIQLAIEIVQILNKLNLARTREPVENLSLRIVNTIVGNLVEELDDKFENIGNSERTTRNLKMSIDGINIFVKSILRFMTLILSRNVYLFGNTIVSQNQRETSNITIERALELFLTALNILSNLPFIAQNCMEQDNFSLFIAQNTPINFWLILNIYTVACTHNNLSPPLKSHNAILKRRSLESLSALIAHSTKLLALKKLDFDATSKSSNKFAEQNSTVKTTSVQDFYPNDANSLEYVLCSLIKTIASSRDSFKSSITENEQNEIIAVSFMDWATVLCSLLVAISKCGIPLPIPFLREVADISKEIMSHNDKEEAAKLLYATLKNVFAEGGSLSLVFIRELLPMIFSNLEDILGREQKVADHQILELILSVILSPLGYSDPGQNDGYINLLLVTISRIYVSKRLKGFENILLTHLNALALCYPEKVRGIMASNTKLLETLEGLSISAPATLPHHAQGKNFEHEDFQNSVNANTFNISEKSEFNSKNNANNNTSIKLKINFTQFCKD